MCACEVRMPRTRTSKAHTDLRGARGLPAGRARTPGRSRVATRGSGASEGHVRLRSPDAENSDFRGAHGLARRARTPGGGRFRSPCAPTKSGCREFGLARRIRTCEAHTDSPAVARGLPAGRARTPGLGASEVHVRLRSPDAENSDFRGAYGLARRAQTSGVGARGLPGADASEGHVRLRSPDAENLDFRGAHGLARRAQDQRRMLRVTVNFGVRCTCSVAPTRRVSSAR